jgi:phage FluMu protein Com
MKTRITVAMIMFIGFVLCSTVGAYMPALIVRECPHCKAHVVQEETVSGNTIGAKFYTDGKREAKMLPNHPWLVKCPECKSLFWVDEAVEVDTGFDAAKGKQQVLALSENELLGFLSGPALPRDKELYVRVWAWRSANDAWRRVPNATPAFSKDQVQNLHALSAMLDESGPNQRILKAEIARESGEFDECLRLLSHPFDERYGHAVGFIKKLAEEKVRIVRSISPTK